MKKTKFNELFLDIMMEVKKTRDEGQKSMHIQKKMYLLTLKESLKVLIYLENRH